ncbi:hypothetical protein EDD22DRAFT_954423 [Suillus occidentalis]|nr:hypothetical protein EDD22DRAFT_954423 [Suillus occidentalis]
MQDDDSGSQPSSKEKGGIHAIIAEIFAKDVQYSIYYRAHPQKFTVAVGNHLTFGVDPTDPSAAANLHEDVLRQLPTYDDLDELWHTIPSYAPKAFSSDHKADHSGHLLSIMNTKSAPTSTAATSGCPAPEEDEDFYDIHADIELDGPEQGTSFAGNNDNNFDDGVMDDEVITKDDEIAADANEDYNMAADEATTSSKNHFNKCLRPFSPSPPPDILPCQPPSSVVSSVITSSAQSYSLSGSAPTRSPTSNTSVSTKEQSVKCVRSEITDVCDKMQLLAQGVVAECNSAKADQKILKLQIHEKEWNQMFSLSQQLLQQSSSSLEHQRTIEAKNADIHLEEAKAQIHASEIELLCLKLQLGEQQLQLQQKLHEVVPAPAESV